MQPPLPSCWRFSGQLLIDKANQGVRVLVLVWEDKFNLMKTGDKATFEFFEGSRVICRRCPRLGVNDPTVPEV